MKHIVNQVDHLITEAIAGQALAYPQLIQVPQTFGFYQPSEAPPKIAVISGGGSGHEPADLGYVGTGMLTAAVMGPLWTPPTAEAIVTTVKAIVKTRQVLLIVKNFSADRQVFTTAQQQLVQQDYQVEQVVVTDYISVNPQDYQLRERGVAGTVLLQKILGYYAQQNVDLVQLVEIGQSVNRQLKTLGVALAAPTLPGHLEAQFELQADQVDYGIGIHGEPGYRREPVQSAELLANELLNKLLHQYSVRPQRVAVLINGLGATPLLELYVIAQDVEQLLRLQQIEVAFVKVGNQMTAYNTQGVSVSLLALASDEWLTALQAPTTAAAW